MRRDEDLTWLTAAVELAGRCPPSDSAFSVGAVLVGRDQELIATGFSREEQGKDHAEEVALRRAAASGAATAVLAGASLYTSLEPCRSRASRPVPCAELILGSGVRRVVFAWREPDAFTEGGGAAWLADQGLTVVEIPELAAAAIEPNRHLT
jgi:pyrimidine deaminase RibD-like protein